MAEQRKKPNFDKLLSQHKRPEFLITTTQKDIDRLIKLYITNTEAERRKGK